MKPKLLPDRTLAEVVADHETPRRAHADRLGVTLTQLNRAVHNWRNRQRMAQLRGRFPETIRHLGAECAVCPTCKDTGLLPVPLGRPIFENPCHCVPNLTPIQQRDLMQERRSVVETYEAAARASTAWAEATEATLRTLISMVVGYQNMPGYSLHPMVEAFIANIRKPEARDAQAPVSE